MHAVTLAFAGFIKELLSSFNVITFTLCFWSEDKLLRRDPIHGNILQQIGCYYSVQLRLDGYISINMLNCFAL